jgi:hypothetical protein
MLSLTTRGEEEEEEEEEVVRGFCGSGVGCGVWSRKWRESWKRDIEEEVVLAAVQEELLRESKEKSQIALAKETKKANEEKEQEVEAQWRRRPRGVGG